MSPRIVFASFGRIAEGRAGQQMQFPHLRSDQAFDVAAKMRLSWRPPFDGYSRILASPLEGSAAEVGAIVDVERLGETGNGPLFRDLALSQPSRLVEDGMQQAKAGRQPGRSLHCHVEPSDYSAADVHREREPWSADRLPDFFVDHKYVCLRVVDLHQLERPRGTERPGNRLGALCDLGLAASSRTLLEVDVLEAGHDRSTMRNPQVGRDALLPDFADQFGDYWPVSGQEDCIDGGSDDLLPRVVQHAVTVRPAAFAIHQRRDRPTGAECPNETICGGFADAELAREIENVADTPAVRSISQKPTDGVCTPTRFSPLRIGDLVGERLVHEKIRRKNPGD